MSIEKSRQRERPNINISAMVNLLKTFAENVVRCCCRSQQVRLSCTVQYYHTFPHNVSTQHPMRATHTTKLSKHQPFRRKFVISKQEKCVQKSVEMFYTLIWCFELLFPENDQVWGRFLRFLTLNKSFGGWSPVCSSQQPSLLLT